MRLFVYDVTISMKSGNTLRFRTPELEMSWGPQGLTALKWSGAEGVKYVQHSQVEAVQYTRVLNWRRAFRG